MSRASCRQSAIVCWTSSGATGLRVARERPKSPIVAITPKLATGRKLSLVWGVHCLNTKDVKNSAQMVDRATKAALSEQFAVPGDRLVITAGMPFGTPGATNLLRIAWVED